MAHALPVHAFGQLRRQTSKVGTVDSEIEKLAKFDQRSPSAMTELAGTNPDPIHLPRDPFPLSVITSSPNAA